MDSSKTEINFKKREDGDGKPCDVPNPRKPKHRRIIRVKETDYCLSHIRPTDVPDEAKIYLKCHVESRSDGKKMTIFKATRKPKHVTFEPFKAAVLPMKLKARKVVAKTKKNNVDIQILVSQISTMALKEMAPTSEIIIDDSSDKSDEVKKLESEISVLNDTNKQLEGQLKFQTQVNSELKTLLVAAVGEDIEARVQHLTEDKLQLARALLNSAQHLNTHREQVEWLAGHCEVWRSKFLASSLMVDELGRWKNILTNHVDELQETIKQLLEERSYIKMNISSTYALLRQIAKSHKLTITDANQQLNIVQLSSYCQRLASALNDSLSTARKYSVDECVTDNNVRTGAEMQAHKILTQSCTSNQSSESVYKSLLPNNTMSTDRCAHCNALTLNDNVQ